MRATIDRSRGFTGQLVELLGPDQLPTRYDVVLALIPLAFVLTFVAAAVLNVTLQTALTAGSLVGVLGVIDALFVNPPTEQPGRPGS